MMVISRLAGEGLAKVWPQRGTFVSRISISAVLSARFIREAVEANLARIVAASCQTDALTRMQEEIALQHRADQAADVESFIESDDRFHQLLARAAGQEPVWAALDRLKAQMNRLRYLSMQSLTAA
ncbi:GntR family transcriptional regulator [Paracoccus subflavus]|uniref:GntR family transcriptional regulator n=1 Tax=Paracoccus subflavus TaxID=2528244 RepID=UPI00248275CF|nr:FCD domain-containing protein [Paracoccus subflavus]